MLFGYPDSSNTMWSFDFNFWPGFWPEIHCIISGVPDHISRRLATVFVVHFTTILVAIKWGGEHRLCASSITIGG